jgi:uncharacterized protein (TIGR00645 family)
MQTGSSPDEMIFRHRGQNMQPAKPAYRLCRSMPPLQIRLILCVFTLNGKWLTCDLRYLPACPPAAWGNIAAPHHACPLAMNKIIKPLEYFIFWSRWLQAPLYLGLIAAQAVYVYQFMHELVHLVSKAGTLSENEVMLIVLGLIDVVMIANLLIMVIIGGYETFVSRLDLEGHPDQPEWLSHVNAGVLKVKLAVALISISSIHLLRTFINAGHTEDRVIIAQIAIHASFLVSALAIAYTDKIMMQTLAVGQSAKH